MPQGDRIANAFAIDKVIKRATTDLIIVQGVLFAVLAARERHVKLWPVQSAAGIGITAIGRVKVIASATFGIAYAPTTTRFAVDFTQRLSRQCCNLHGASATEIVPQDEIKFFSLVARLCVERKDGSPTANDGCGNKIIAGIEYAADTG